MVENGYYPNRQPGKRNCLKCGKPFQSRDVTANRLCEPCSEHNNKTKNHKTFTYSDPNNDK